MSITRGLFLAMLFACIGGVVTAAQDNAMRGMAGMSGAMGQHDMPATVTSLDKKTGLLDVDSDGFKLRLHFPPAALADVKAGDHITLHLGFSKP